MALSDDYARLQGLVAPNRITEGITNRQMARLLKDASKEAESFVLHTVSQPTVSRQLRASQMRSLRAGLSTISTELWTETGKLTTVGMHAQAALAADQAMDRDLFLGMPGSAVVQYSRAMHLNVNQGVEALLSRRTNGYTLSERIYKNGAIGVQRASAVVERGLLLQKSAREIARDVRQHFDPNVPGGSSYAARRLARTEINNAHHETTIRQSELRPWVLGYQWNLSSSHPRPDPCDTLANDDHDNLGPGVFKKGNAPSRPHPQCLCYLTHIQEPTEEFLAKALNGDYEEFMFEHGVECL